MKRKVKRFRNNYQDLKREIGRLWGIRHLEVVPIVVGALRAVSNRLDAWFEKRGAYMPTLPDNPGVSRIQNESPGLPYG